MKFKYIDTMQHDQWGMGRIYQRPVTFFENKLEYSLQNHSATGRKYSLDPIAPGIWNRYANFNVLALPCCAVCVVFWPNPLRFKG